MSLSRRINYVMTGEDAASNLEIIVWMSVVLVIAGFLFLFRNSIANFIQGATGRVNNMNNEMNNSISGVPVVTPST